MKHNWGKELFPKIVWFQEGPGVRNTQYRDTGVKLLNVANLVDSHVDLSTSNRYISEEEAYGKYKHFLVDDGDFIIASSGIQASYFHKKMGFINKTHLPLCMNTSTIRFKVLDDSKLNIYFFQYYLKSFDFNLQLQKALTGCAQLNFGPSHLKKMKCPLPPMVVQEHIVAELDKINDVIEDCRELLRNLDALAQSLFYDFFGDPVTNPKGWPLYKLSSISQLINGRAYKQNELLDEGKYKVIRVGNFFTNSDYYYSDLELSPEKYIDYGDLIFAWSASFGAFIWQGDKVIYHYHIWKILFDDNLLNKIFYKFLLNEMTSSFMKDLHGIGMMHLTKAGMENYMLPVPPLSLQEQFAARIEQIEAQKKAVEQTIAELQTLLDSRMDYWFN